VEESGQRKSCASFFPLAVVFASSPRTVDRRGLQRPPRYRIPEHRPQRAQHHARHHRSAQLTGVLLAIRQQSFPSALAARLLHELMQITAPDGDERHLSEDAAPWKDLAERMLAEDALQLPTARGQHHVARGGLPNVR
jgi:hypothetical protein